MKKETNDVPIGIFITIFVLSLVLFTWLASKGHSQYIKGYEEGYKANNKEWVINFKLCDKKSINLYKEIYKDEDLSKVCIK